MKRVYISSDIAHRNTKLEPSSQFLKVQRVTSGNWKNKYSLIKYLIIFLSVVLGSMTVTAQEKQKDIKTETLLVSGCCGMCQKRIEKAAYIKGVKRAEWDKEKTELTVTYKPSKTSSDDILKSVAAAGYDSEKYTGDQAAYEKLSECCHYRTTSCED